ncbi:MAG: hypothetical protein J6M23_02280 [Bacteroidales bacterium]|nr:hypothetical protein [Bacteroidales bacterium]
MKSINIEDIQEIVTEHNIDIKNLKERMTDQERRATAPIYAVITPEMQESVANAIAAQVMEQIEDCELPAPDISGLKERIEQFASMGFAKAVETYKIRIETDCVHRLDSVHERKLNEAVNTLEWAVNKLDETKIAPWRIWLRDLAAWLFIPLAITFAVVIGVNQNSVEHWGKRYYAVCNHRLQQNETILAHRGDAYEFVLAFFNKGGDEKEKMKVHIREQEQNLKLLEMEAKGGESNAKKP